jgi:hypothetical protein
MQDAWHVSHALMKYIAVYNAPDRMPQAGKLLSISVTCGVLNIELMPYRPEPGAPYRHFKVIQFDLRNWMGGMAPDGSVIGGGHASVSGFDCPSCKLLSTAEDPDTVYCPKDQASSAHNNMCGLDG